MKHDLLFILKKLSQENTRELKTGGVISQASILFSEKTNILFVKDFKNYDPIFDYRDLSFPALPEEDQNRLTQQKALYDAEVEEAKQKGEKPKLYNGDNLILTGLEYDDTNNTIYIKADKVDYWFIRAIQSKVVFAPDSPVYQYIRTTMGAHTPVITQDHSTYLLERSKAETQFFCPAAGFLEAKKDNPSLVNLVERTAEGELFEEMLGDPDKLRAVPYANGVRALNYVEGDTPKWKPKVVDFIVPTDVACRNQTMETILGNNLAKDAKEHTKKFFEIGLKDGHNRPSSFGLKINVGGINYHDYTKPDQPSTEYKGTDDAPGDFAFGASIAACMIKDSGLPPHLPKHLPGTFARLFYIPKNNPQKSIDTPEVESRANFKKLLSSL